MRYVDYPRGQSQAQVPALGKEQALVAMRTWQLGTRAVYAEAIGAGITILSIPYGHIMFMLVLLVPWIIGHAACVGNTYRAWMATGQGRRNTPLWAGLGAFTASILPVVGLLVADVLRTSASRRLSRSGFRVRSLRHVGREITRLEQALMQEMNTGPALSSNEPVN